MATLEEDARLPVTRDTNGPPRTRVQSWLRVRNFEHRRQRILEARRQELTVLTGDYGQLTQRFPFIRVHTTALIRLAAESNLGKGELDKLLAFSLWRERPERKEIIAHVLGIEVKALKRDLNEDQGVVMSSSDMYLRIYQNYFKAEESFKVSCLDTSGLPRAPVAAWPRSDKSASLDTVFSDVAIRHDVLALLVRRFSPVQILQEIAFLHNFPPDMNSRYVSEKTGLAKAEIIQAFEQLQKEQFPMPFKIGDLKSPTSSGRIFDYPRMIIPIDTLPIFRHPLWFGAGMEVGTAMGYYLNNRKNAAPQIIVSEKDQKRIEALRSLCGGIISPAGGSSLLAIRGEQAAALAELVSGYSPSRGAIVKSFREWKKAKSWEDRYAIACSFNPQQIDTQIDPSTYSMLVARAEFLAGIFEWRGAEISLKRSGSFMLRVSSKNLFLLGILQKAYGGYISVNQKELRQALNSRENFGINHGADWNISSGLFKDLLRMVRPHLLIRDFKTENEI